MARERRDGFSVSRPLGRAFVMRDAAAREFRSVFFFRQGAAPHGPPPSFRETSAAIETARSKGLLAVEVEAAALYAFARAGVGRSFVSPTSGTKWDAPKAISRMGAQWRDCCRGTNRRYRRSVAQSPKTNSLPTQAPKTNTCASQADRGAEHIPSVRPHSLDCRKARAAPKECIRHRTPHSCAPRARPRRGSTGNSSAPALLTPGCSKDVLFLPIVPLYSKHGTEERRSSALRAFP